jgi:hypothetical protein
MVPCSASGYLGWIATRHCHCHNLSRLALLLPYL